MSGADIVAGSAAPKRPATGGREAFRRSPTLDLAEQVSRARAAGETVFSLSTPTFAEIGPALLRGREASSRLMPAEGDPALRDLVRERLFSRWYIPEHEVILTAGAKAALFSILRHAASPGERIAVVSPRWPTYDDIVRLLGCTLEPIDTTLSGAFLPDPCMLDRIARRSEVPLRALVIANPNNPTGAICDAGLLEALRAVAVRHGMLLVLDESFSEAVFDETTFAGATLSRAGAEVAIVNSLSKGFHLQGLRIGACAVHRSVCSEVVAIHQAVAGGVSSLSQAAARQLLERPAAPPLSLDAQRERMLAFIEARGWPCLPAQGSFYHFPDVGSIDAFADALDGSSVLFLAGDAFGAGVGNHVRMCFARPLAELEDIIGRLAASLPPVTAS